VQGLHRPEGSFAPCYNPALLAENPNKREVSRTADSGLREINVADSIDNLSYIDIDNTLLTAGLGVGIQWLQSDLSGRYSTEEGEYDGESFRRSRRIELFLVSKWN